MYIEFQSKEKIIGSIVHGLYYSSLLACEESELPTSCSQLNILSDSSNHEESLVLDRKSDPINGIFSILIDIPSDGFVFSFFDLYKPPVFDDARFDSMETL